MLTEQEAQELMTTLIDLRERTKESDDPVLKSQLNKHETLCMEKFKYLVTMKTGRYKSFSNYEDLNQEGFEALLKGMKNYNPKKGNIFWWFHRYIDTRISRSANLHTTIRFPLKIAKANPPHKEALMPTLIEETCCPDKELEQSQTVNAIQSAISLLTDEQKEIVNLVYGMNGDKPMSVNKICKKFNISRANCIKLINNSLLIMKENIKI